MVYTVLDGVFGRWERIILTADFPESGIGWGSPAKMCFSQFLTSTLLRTYPVLTDEHESTSEFIWTYHTADSM